MSEPFVSASWFRISKLRPALRSDVEVSRHRYRQRGWYVLRDPISGQTHRLSRVAYQFVGRIDGKRSVNEIFDDLSDELGVEAPSQSDIVKLMTQLHGADLLKTDTVPDAYELVDRQDRRLRSKLLGYVKSPFALRIPLVNPDRFLDATAGAIVPLFGRVGLACWLVLVVAGGIVAAMNLTGIAGDGADRLLAYNNLGVLALSYVLVKLLHELGHGYAVKAYGGEVREMGVMLLVFFPVPYVDASAATALRSKWKRATVGAAGVAVELALAAVAVFGWVLAEPGLVRAFCLNVMLIGGISTLLFNGNPLLRFDGYYVLSDLIEIPNLAQKSNKYLAYLVERYLFGVRASQPQAADLRQRIWYLLYGPASYVYRLVVMAGLALIIGSRFFVVGIILALWAVATGVAAPIGKGISTILTAPRLRRSRGRAVLVTASVTGLLVLFAWAVPLPSHVTTEGIVWLPEGSTVTARTDGFVEAVLARPGDRVRAGQTLVRMADPDWASKRRVIEAKVEELQAQYVAVRFDNRAEAQVVALEREREQAELDREAARQRDGTLVSPRDGVFVYPDAEGAAGRFVREGTVIGYVIPPTTGTLRILVAQADIDLARNRIESISVRLAEHPDTAFQARIVREVPAAASELPSKALGLGGGGNFLTDPSDPKGLKSLQRLFQFDIALADPPARIGYGGTALVRLQLQWEPLGTRIYRRVRQLFLGRFNV
jgi:putative peptide zinc metalloprotease protein